MWEKEASAQRGPGKTCPTERRGVVGHTDLLSIPWLQQMLVI